MSVVVDVIVASTKSIDKKDVFFLMMFIILDRSKRISMVNGIYYQYRQHNDLNSSLNWKRIFMET